MGRGVYTVEPRRNSRYTAASMAKGKRNKADSAPDPGSAEKPKSLLDDAWRAYEAGDSVLARKASALLLASAPKEADESLAKKLGKQLFVGVADADAKQVATELAARTKATAKPLLFAVMAAAIWLGLLAIATRG